MEDKVFDLRQSVDALVFGMVDFNRGTAMSPGKKTWTESDFDEMSWHDNHVHGIRLCEGEYGAGTVRLDIDYILEWKPPVDNRYAFLIAPADLTFMEVTDLRIALDYAGSNAGLMPFSIHEIRRETVSYSPAMGTYRWTIAINWPVGEITFVAKGFIQKLRGQMVVNQQQWLMPEQRLHSGPTPSAGR